jgi:hypothetical protein
MFETLHPASGMKSDKLGHSLAAFEDKSEPCESEPVLEQSEGKNLRRPEFVTSFVNVVTKLSP